MKYYSDYYDRLFTKDEVQKGLDLYLQTAKKQGFTPEVEQMSELKPGLDDQEKISHIMYHAEWAGMKF